MVFALWSNDKNGMTTSIKRVNITWRRPSHICSTTCVPMYPLWLFNHIKSGYSNFQREETYRLLLLPMPPSSSYSSVIHDNVLGQLTLNDHELIFQSSSFSYSLSWFGAWFMVFSLSTISTAKRVRLAGGNCGVAGGGRGGKPSADTWIEAMVARRLEWHAT